MESQNLDYKTLINRISENGDLCVLGCKGTTKSTLLMNLCRELRKDANNHVIIFETFPKWINEFDKIPYLTISDCDVQEKDKKPYLQENKSFIEWSTDYDILNEREVKQFLKENKDCLFMVEIQDMERISAFLTFVIYAIYRKQYLRMKANNLEIVNENYYFLCEEAHNLLDSTVIQKKTFNKLRKVQSEMRNLKMHLIVVALRLQDLNPKIRSKMSLLLARVSLDDFQLKVRNLLRNSKYRDIITQLPKGQFVYPELDLLLTTEPFKQEGTPYEWKPQPIEILRPEPQPKKPKGFWAKLFYTEKPDLKGSPEYEAWKAKQLKKRRIGLSEESLNKDSDEGELDLYMTEENPTDEDLLFPT